MRVVLSARSERISRTADKLLVKSAKNVYWIKKRITGETNTSEKHGWQMATRKWTGDTSCQLHEPFCLRLSPIFVKSKVPLVNLDRKEEEEALFVPSSAKQLTRNTSSESLNQVGNCVFYKTRWIKRTQKQPDVEKVRHVHVSYKTAACFHLGSFPHFALSVKLWHLHASRS